METKRSIGYFDRSIVLSVQIGMGPKNCDLRKQNPIKTNGIVNFFRQTDLFQTKEKFTNEEEKCPSISNQIKI